MNKPRILHVTIGLGYGGMEMALLRLIAADQKHEHWVVGLMHDTSPDPWDTYAQRIKKAGGRAISLGFPRGSFTARGLGKLWTIFRECRPVLLSGWAYHGSLACAALSFLSAGRTPFVAHFRAELTAADRASFKQRSLLVACAAAARFASRVVYNSTLGLRSHLAFGFGAARSVVIPNGFDPTLFDASAATRLKTRVAMDLGESDIACGLVARLHPHKDHATFLRAAREAATRDPRLVFVLAGQGVETIPSTPGLAELAARLPAERLKLLGHVGDTPALYSALDLVVLSSVTESFPNVLCEAMVAGVPCVSTDVGDARLILGDTGMITPVGDPAKLADAIIQTASSNLRALGEMSRVRALERYGLDRFCAAFNSVFEEAARPADPVSAR